MNEIMDEEEANNPSEATLPKKKYQSSIIYNKFLPMSEKLDEEAEIKIAEIKANLGKAVMARELQPGCSIWIDRLTLYILTYGYKFSKEDHITFIKLVYELIMIPNLEPFLIGKFATMIVLLLKKEDLISPEDLELPWQPLYQLMCRVMTSSERNLGIFRVKADLVTPSDLELPWHPLYLLSNRILTSRESALGMYRYYCMLDKTLNVLTQTASTYFPVSATQEILDELRPKLCPLDSSTMKTTMEALQLFLPVKLRPEYHPMGFKLWFDEFMTLWEVCHNAPQWENEIMWIMAKLAGNNIGYVDWEPHIPLMFTRFVRCLNLPVSYKKIQSCKQHKIEIGPICVWIVSALGNGSSAQTYLEKFLKTIETYYHPANCGRWIKNLRELLFCLPFNFLLRIRKERFKKPAWATPIPDSHKLTDADIDAFVKCMMPLAMTAMFNKWGLTESCSALQSLATLRPNLVIPDVLERMYATFDTITEPHKLTAAMLSMTPIVRPLAQGPRNYNKGYTYPEGPLHILPLLFLSLPGIDPNDISKSFITFRMISVYATLIPIVDCSTSTADMDEEERLICETTSRFEDFILQFLDRIFVFIDSSSLELVRLENLPGDEKNKLESATEAILIGACSSVLARTSEPIFNSALHKMRAFVTERILETKVAGKCAAVLCRVFANIDSPNTLKALLPLLVQTILDCIEEGEDVVKEENLDNRLSYALLLLTEMILIPGCYLVPYMDLLLKVLDKTLRLKSREGAQLACKLLKSVLESLSTLTPYDYYTIRHRNSINPNYPFIRDWGQGEDLDTFYIKWYIPGEREIKIMQEIFLRYLPPEIEKLEKYCENCSSLTREELLTSLNIVHNVVGGLWDYLPLWEEEPLPVLKSVLPWKVTQVKRNINGEVTMQDGSNVRRYLSQVMSKLQDVMLRNAEDDTKSLLVLIKIWSKLLIGKLCDTDCYEMRRKNYMTEKLVYKDKLMGKKGYPDVVIYDRAGIQLDLRTKSYFFVLTETHKSITIDLFKLATSRYADVRAKAQNILFTELYNFPYAYKVVEPLILEVLGRDTEEHHDAYKGVLYLLLGPKQSALIVQKDWEFIRNVWPALVLSKPSEKLSVIRLKDTLVEAVHKHFPTTAITVEVPDSCVEQARLLWKNSPKPVIPIPDEDFIQKGIETLKQTGERNVKLYNELLNDLLSAILDKNIHWRHRLMAMYFIRDLVHPDQTYPANVVRFALNSLITDSLLERKIATVIVTYMLKQQKRKHLKIPLDISKISCKSSSTTSPIVSSAGHPTSLKCTPGRRPDNSWLQYDYETRPLTAKQWDEPRFVHEPYIGYYTWPKNMTVYAPSNQQPTLDPEKRVLTDMEREVDLFFSDSKNVKRFVKLFSLEEKKGKDKFNGYRFLLFKGLFRNHGDAHLKHFLPHLERLVADKQESSQRLAAEITAGLIRGAKHWPFEMVSKMWDSLLPIIRTALTNISVETLRDWGVCFATAQERRDPNRQHWLLECLMEEPPMGTSETSFVECGRLYALQGVLAQQSWRVTQLLQRVFTRLEYRLLTNPFQNVRERLGSLLATVFDADLQFPGPSNGPNVATATSHVQMLIDRVLPKLDKLTQDPSIGSIGDISIPALSSHVAIVQLDDAKTGNNSNEREGAIRLFKTLCNWLVGSVSRSLYGALPGYYDLFPIVCQLENCDTDEELTRTCSITLAILAQALTLPCNMSVALDAVVRISNSPSWWARNTCLDYLQVLVFHNMGIALSKPEWVWTVRNVVLRLLEDGRPEVREKAGQVLGGLLHCAFIPDQEKLLEEFKVKAKTRLRGKKNRSIAQNSNKLETREERDAKINAIRERHAGVLGLCAFIRAHPYDVPKYLPSVFEHLGPHLNDPQPIPVTIRKTLGDFKRTHYDGWSGVSGHAQQFTEEQLTVLEDLSVPPSHYA